MTFKLRAAPFEGGFVVDVWSGQEKEHLTSIGRLDLPDLAWWCLKGMLKRGGVGTKHKLIFEVGKDGKQ